MFWNFISQILVKAHIFREGHTILRSLHLTFDYSTSTYSQKYLWPSQDLSTLLYWLHFIAKLQLVSVLYTNQSLHDLGLISSTWFRYKMWRNVGFVLQNSQNWLIFYLKSTELSHNIYIESVILHWRFLVLYAFLNLPFYKNMINLMSK